VGCERRIVARAADLGDGEGTKRLEPTARLARGIEGASGSRPAWPRGTWTADDTFTAKGCFYQSTFCATIALRFAGDEVFFDQEMNVAFGPTKRPQLVGRAEP
jgi:hypothetical protein